MRVCTFAYVIPVPFTLSIILSTSQLNQTNLPEHQALDFCRGGCRAIVDSSSSHFTVPSEVLATGISGSKLYREPPTSRKRWKQVKPGNPRIKQRYCTYWTSFLLLQMNACQSTRLKLFGKKLLNPPYPSLSGNLPPSKTTYAVRNAVRNAVPYPIMATPSAADRQHTSQWWQPVTSIWAAHPWYSTIHFIMEVTQNENTNMREKIFRETNGKKRSNLLRELF